MSTTKTDLPREVARPDVLIGISTWNRKNIVALNARSLSMADDLSSARILVIDDASTDYDLAFLQSIYPVSSEFKRNDAPSGMASRVARSLMEAFLAGPESTLIILDSDLIVARDFLAQSRAMLPLTGGLLSLFHTLNHPSVEKGELLQKKSVGFAGSVWTRALVREVLEKVPFTIYYDSEICDYLRARRREIFSLKHSAVQHLGLIQGENSKFLAADYGNSFTDTSWYNTSAIHEVFLEGCRQEFARIDQRHRELAVHYQEEAHRMRRELELLRSTLALLQGQGNTPVKAGAFRKRLSAQLARLGRILIRLGRGGSQAAEH